MSQKPIFVATHPRACSTAFEMVFMTRPDTLVCAHEPFGDAFYYGPERLSDRYENDVKGREDSNFINSTYKTVLDRLENDGAEREPHHFCEDLNLRYQPSTSGDHQHRLSNSLDWCNVLTYYQGKRVFIKDITHYLLPPNGKPASIAPSLSKIKRGVGTGDDEGNPGKEPPYPYDTETEPGNPTVIPTEILKQFHFTFLIRHPKRAIPSYFRCTIPPQDKITGFYNFMPCEAGYDEVRRTFDYLKSIGEIGPGIAGRDETKANGNGETKAHGVDICVIDADDLLDHPPEIIEAYCKSVGIDYSPEMLKWETEEEQERARKAFAKWPGFHDDALEHSSLKPRDHVRSKTECKDLEEEHAQWVKKFGEEGAKIIRETVEKNIPDYEYLKQFAIKV